MMEPRVRSRAGWTRYGAVRDRPRRIEMMAPDFVAVRGYDTAAAPRGEQSAHEYANLIPGRGSTAPARRRGHPGARRRHGDRNPGAQARGVRVPRHALHRL